MLATASRRFSGEHCCSLYTTKAVAADRLTLAEETPVTPSSAFVACEAQAAQWSPSRGNVFLIIPRPNLQYMIRRRTCLPLFRGALLPRVENTSARERFIPQALSHPYSPFLSVPVSVLLPVSFVPLLLHLSLRLGLRPLTHLSVAPSLYAPLPPTPDITLARVYNYGRERGGVGESAPSRP